jgi:hypothetical protein
LHSYFAQAPPTMQLVLVPSFRAFLCVALSDLLNT